MKVKKWRKDEKMEENRKIDINEDNEEELLDKIGMVEELEEESNTIDDKINYK